MAITTEILRTYRAPRAVIRGLLAGGQREDRAIVYLMAACLVIYIGRWPVLRRQAFLDAESPPLEGLLSAYLFVWLFAMPLILYGVAALSHLVARLFGGQGTWWGARLALFWTLLVISPLTLLNGLVGGLIGPGMAQNITIALTTIAFGVIWSISLSEAEQRPATGGA